MIRFICLFFPITLLLSCDNLDRDISREELIGVWAGSFTYSNTSQEIPFYRKSFVMVAFNEDGFLGTGYPDRYPAGGSGYFDLQTRGIAFQDTNIWTTEFDPNLILNGEFHLTYKHGELLLRRKKGDIRFEYVLSK